MDRTILAQVTATGSRLQHEATGLYHPSDIVAFPPLLAERIAALVDHVPVDLDDPIEGPIDI